MKRDLHMRDDIGVALRCGSCGVGQVRGAEAREGQFRHEFRTGSELAVRT